jgi:hypothetical protein
MSPVKFDNSETGQPLAWNRAAAVCAKPTAPVLFATMRGTFATAAGVGAGVGVGVSVGVGVGSGVEIGAVVVAALELTGVESGTSDVVADPLNVLRAAECCLGRLSATMVTASSARPRTTTMSPRIRARCRRPAGGGAAWAMVADPSF